MQEAGVVSYDKAFRYPYGNPIDPSYKKVFQSFLDSLGYQTYYRDVDLKDRKRKQHPRKSEILNKITDGDIVLLHEWSGT